MLDFVFLSQVHTFRNLIEEVLWPLWPLHDVLDVLAIYHRVDDFPPSSSEWSLLILEVGGIHIRVNEYVIRLDLIFNFAHLSSREVCTDVI